MDQSGAIQCQEYEMEALLASIEKNLEAASTDGAEAGLILQIRETLQQIRALILPN